MQLDKNKLYLVSASVIWFWLFCSFGFAKTKRFILPPGYTGNVLGFPMPNPIITYDVVAVKVSKVKRPRWGDASFEYSVIKSYRQHPDVEKRVPNRGLASYGQHFGPLCATDYQGPEPPTNGSIVYLLGIKNGKQIRFLSRAITYPFYESKKFPDDEEEIIPFLNKTAKERRDWLKWRNCKPKWKKSIGYNSYFSGRKFLVKATKKDLMYILLSRNGEATISGTLDDIGEDMTHLTEKIAERVFGASYKEHNEYKYFVSASNRHVGTRLFVFCAKYDRSGKLKSYYVSGEGVSKINWKSPPREFIR